MMNFKRTSSSLVTAAALLVSPYVAAQELIPMEAPQETNLVGLGVFSVPDYYGSDKNEGVVGPIARYSWDGASYVQLLGTELSANLMPMLMPMKEWRAGPLIRVRTRRDDDVDSETVGLMRPVASATEIGAFVAYHMPLDPSRPLHKVVFSADVVGNTNDVYDGATGNVRVNYVYPFEQSMVGRPLIGTIGFGMFFASSSFNRKYFGVTGSDLPLFPELAGREYRPGSGITSLKIPFSLTTPLSKEWLLTLAGRYEHLLDDAKDSPVVDTHGDADQWSIGIAASYLF